MKTVTRMWKFETKNFLITWDIEPDEDVDASFDETGETQRKLDSGEWEAFESIMTCTYKPTGAVLAEEALCGSIYADPSEFRDHIGAQGKWGSYFKDMVLTVCHESRAAMIKMQDTHMRSPS